MTAKSLELVRTPAPIPPTRGRLLFVDDVVRDIFRGRKTPWWVRHNVAPNQKFHIGREVAWYEGDVHAWLESLCPRSA